MVPIRGWICFQVSSYDLHNALVTFTFPTGLDDSVLEQAQGGPGSLLDEDGASLSTDAPEKTVNTNKHHSKVTYGEFKMASPCQARLQLPDDSFVT